ncbi:MAG: hypothetical protein Q7S95_03750 [bacterium]|nr:hypothetical protein [bacterium]
MTDQIQFEGEEQSGSILYSRFERSVQVPRMVRWVLSMGIAKSAQAADYVLLAVATGAIVLAFIVPLLFERPSSPVLSPEQIQQNMSSGMSSPPSLIP